MTTNRDETKGVCWVCLESFDITSTRSKIIIPYEARAIHPGSGLGFIPAGDSQESTFSDNGCYDIYTRFLLFSGRFLKLDTTTEVFLRVAKAHRNATGENVQAFCESCEKRVRYICDLYAELQAIKWRLIWKLEEMDQTMSTAKCSRSYLARKLMKPLMEQLKVNTVTRVEMFRKVFQIKCRAKRNANLPKTLVPRGLFPEHWKVGYTACKSMMMRLIVVFLLASFGEKEEKSKRKTILPEVTHRKRGRPKKKMTVDPKQSFNNKTNKKSEADIVFNKNSSNVELGMVNNETDNNENMKTELKTEQVGEEANSQPRSECVGAMENENDLDWSGPSSPINYQSAGSGAECEPNIENFVEESSHQKRWNLRRRNRNPVKYFGSEIDSDTDRDADSDKDYEQNMDENEDDVKIEDNVEAVDENKLESGTLNRSKMKNKRGWPRIGDVEPTLPCPKCKKMFIDKRCLSSHMIYKHKIRLTYTCPICGQKFIRWKDLRNHKRAMHRKMKAHKGWSKKPRKCVICLKEFSTISALDNHRREANHYLNKGPCKKPVNCPICNETFQNIGLMRIHRTAVHGRYSRATAGGKRRRRHGDEQTEKRTGRNRRGEVQCTRCQDMFPTVAEMRKHRRIIHKVEQGRVPVGETSCTRCDLVFPTGKEMLEHRRKEHRYIRKETKSKISNKDPNYCKKCNKVFYSREQLKDHKKTVHNMDWTINECPICFRNVIGKERFEKHLKGHENNTLKNVTVFYCEVCGHHYYKEDSLKAHMTRVHKDRYSCFVCKEDFESGKLLRDHLVTHEKPQKFFHCMICFRGFSSQQYYEIHSKIGHKDKRFSHCDYDMCNEIFENNEKLNEHLKRHAEEAKERGDLEWSEVYICKKCGKGFVKQYNFTMHELTHTPHNEGRTGYDCPVGGCGQTVRYIETLLTHYNRIHGLGLMPCICHVCNAAFTSTLWYKHHMRLCIGEEAMEANEQRFCVVCGDDFPSKKELVDHKVEKHNYKRRTHENTEISQCSEPGCEEKGSLYQLCVHMLRVHGKRVRDPCEKCGKLIMRCNLSEHMKTHEPPRHPCDICGKKFTKPNQVRKHKEAFHTEHRLKAFTCHICGLSYYTKNGLLFHNYSKHTEKAKLKHICPYCGRGYGRKPLFTSHKRTCAKQHGMQDGQQERKEEDSKNSKSPTKQKAKPHKKKKSKIEDEDEMSDKSTTTEENEEEEVKSVYNCFLQEEKASSSNAAYPHQVPQQQLHQGATMSYEEWLKMSTTNEAYQVALNQQFSNQLRIDHSKNLGN